MAVKLFLVEFRFYLFPLLTVFSFITIFFPRGVLRGWWWWWFGGGRVVLPCELPSNRIKTNEIKLDRIVSSIRLHEAMETIHRFKFRKGRREHPGAEPPCFPHHATAARRDANSATEAPQRRIDG